MRVSGVDVLEELLATFYQLGDNDVVHTFEPNPACIGGRLMALKSNYSISRLAMRGLIVEPLAVPWTLPLHI